MRRARVAIAVLAAGVGACGGGKRQKRTGDAAPVEVIVAPPLDGGPAGEVDEREPNDTADIGSPLALGGSSRGRIEPDTDVDSYRIEVAQAGSLAVQLAAVEGVDLALEIEDAAGAVVARSDRGGARVVEGVPNLGVSPGRYTAVVRKILPKVRKPPRGRKPPPPPEPPPPGSAPVYHLTAQVTPFARNAEREPDDDRGTANDLIVGDAVSGYLGWTGDSDVWKLSVEALSARNVLDVELAAVESVALTLELADGVGQTLLSRKAPKNTPLIIRNLVPVVPQGAPPFHYLTVKADKSNPETPYQLRVTGHDPDTDAEAEPNETPDQAMAFPAERTVVHATWTPGDVDCFAVPPDPGPRTIDVTIAPGGGASLQAELIVDGKSVAESKKPGKGSEQKVTGAVPPSGRAVIRVRGTESSAETKYDVHVHEGPASGP